MKTFPLTIVSDMEIIFSGQVRYCGVTTYSGSIGFEADHEPFIGVLRKETDLDIVDADSKERTVKIESGMLSFKDNSCTITVQPTGRTMDEDSHHQKSEHL